MGLSCRQEISWDESESSKKQKSTDKKKAADRYFSTASRQLLRSEPPVLTGPTQPESIDVIKSASIISLGEDKEKKGEETGGRFRHCLCHCKTGYV